MISSVGQVEYVSLCPSLRHLTLWGNPLVHTLASTTQYRTTILALAPSYVVCACVCVRVCEEHPAHAAPSPVRLETLDGLARDVSGDEAERQLSQRCSSAGSVSGPRRSARAGSAGGISSGGDEDDDGLPSAALALARPLSRSGQRPTTAQGKA